MLKKEKLALAKRFKVEDFGERLSSAAILDAVFTSVARK